LYKCSRDSSWGCVPCQQRLKLLVCLYICCLLRHIEDAEATVVAACSFPAAGGNALLVNGYARNTTIRDSEFTHSGDSAIVTLGYAEKQDGTHGRQPRGTVVEGCVMTDAGVWLLRAANRNPLAQLLKRSAGRCGRSLFVYSFNAGCFLEQLREAICRV
jgi:hypothetical protein